MNKNYYFVCLCFENKLKDYQFFVGTAPYQYPAIQNELHPEQKWFVVQMLGPLSTEHEANRLYNLWNKPRVKRGELLTIGLELMQQYGLKMWTDETPDKPLAIEKNTNILPPLTVGMVKKILDKEVLDKNK